MAVTDPNLDVLNPNTPKKKPVHGGVDPGVPVPAGTPANALDTGIPPPPANQPAPQPQAQASTMAAPQTGGVDTSPATAGVAPQQGIAQLNTLMQSRHNRPLSQQEITALAQAIGAPQGPGGTYTQQQFAQAQDYVSRYSGDINNPFPAAPGTPAPAAPPPPGAPAPGGGIPPEQALQQINAAMLARVGHYLTPQEQAGLAQAVGAPQGPGGTYTQAQVDQALDFVSRYSGNLEDPWGALPEEAPGSTTSLANRRLTELLGTNFNEVDPNSQAIQQPLGAFRSAQNRATDRAKISNALRAQREGMSGGAEEAGLMGLLEEQGQNEASFEANLYAQELAGQRQRLTQAIELATQAGLQNKARELQEELGKMDIELRKLLGQGQLALGARSLEQNDRQFLEQMGFNYAGLQGQLNNNAIQQLIDAL